MQNSLTTLGDDDNALWGGRGERECRSLSFWSTEWSNRIYSRNRTVSVAEPDQIYIVRTSVNMMDPQEVEPEIR